MAGIVSQSVAGGAVAVAVDVDEENEGEEENTKRVRRENHQR